MSFQTFEERSITKKVLGEEHPDFATSLNNLAILKYNEAKYNEALDLMEFAHAIFLKTFGPNHPHTKSCAQGLEVIKKRSRIKNPVLCTNNVIKRMSLHERRQILHQERDLKDGFTRFSAHLM